MGKISENTLVPIGLAVSVIGGAAWWLSALYLKVNSTAAAMDEMQKGKGLSDRALNRIDRRLMGIEIKLGIKPYKGDE